MTKSLTSKPSVATASLSILMPPSASNNRGVRFLSANGQNMNFRTLGEAGQYLLARNIIARSAI
jgi:hypothetical protein